MRYGFVGGGTMAEALLKGMLARGVARAADVQVGEPVPARRDHLAAQYHVATDADNARAVDGAEMVVLAVKPQAFPAVAQGLASALKRGQTVLSILAGTRIATLQSGLDHEAVVRVMPNTPAQIGMGISVWTATPAVSQEHRDAARKLLSGVGEEREVGDEHYVDMATALSGGGPAYVAIYMEALMDAGVALGLPRDLARTLTIQTVLGTAQLAKDTGKHTSELKDMVTSPGGTTIAALQVMERGALRGVIMDAIAAAYRRAEELGNAR